MPRCMVCRKSLLKCGCNKQPSVHPKDKRFTKNKPNGWCSVCQSRVINGQCMNMTCSTNKGKGKNE